jgi:hypothetical protein
MSLAGAPLLRYDSRSRGRRLKAPLLAAGAVLVLSVLLHVRDPHQRGSWGFCPWLLLTGTQCPGCGGLRAVNDLTNGDIAGAASSNLLLVGSIPLVGFLWLRWLRDRWQGRSRVVSTHRAVLWCGVFVAVVVVFWVVRNLPFGAWLAA